MSFVFLTHSQEPTKEQLRLEYSEVESQIKGSFSISGELSFQSLRRDLGEQRADVRPGIQNMSLIAKYTINKELDSYFEILGEQEQEETNIYLGQVYIDYFVPFYKRLQFSVGNIYYSYGVLTGKEGVFARRPDYYQDLLVSRRGIDLGASVRWQGIKEIPLYLSYSYFSGQTLRTGDRNIENAEVNPQYVNLEYSPAFLKAQFTYLNRKYKNQPHFGAVGLSIESQEFKFWKNRLVIKGLSEFWNMEYTRQDGLQRTGSAQLYGSYIEFFQLYSRLIYSEEDWGSSSPIVSEMSSDFRMSALGIRLNRHIQFEYQNIQGFERRSSLKLKDKNEEAWRVYLRL